MLISELQEKLEKVKQEVGDVEVYMECWSNVATNYVCLVKDEYNNKYEVYITDSTNGLAQVLDVEDIDDIEDIEDSKLIRKF